MPATAVFSKSVPPIFPPCPTCNKEMRLTAITPTGESPIYEYICSDDGDRLSWQPAITLPKMGMLAHSSIRTLPRN